MKLEDCHPELPVIKTGYKSDYTVGRKGIVKVVNHNDQRAQVLWTETAKGAPIYSNFKQTKVGLLTWVLVKQLLPNPQL